MDEPQRRSPLSCALFAADSFASRAAVAALVAVLAFGALAGFVTGVLPASWRLWFDTISAAITLTMVFSIQHAQTRNQAALQLKLDELLKAVPEADDKVVKVETASDDELHELHARELEHRVSAYGRADSAAGAGAGAGAAGGEPGPGGSRRQR